MFKIEKSLLLKQDSAELTLKSVIREFLKEANMLISNIHLTCIYLRKEVGDQFPIEANKYDGSWYKNLFVAAEIIIDRLHSRIEENKDYLRPFNDIHECDFLAFARKWNKINFMVKYNTSDEEWESLCKNYNIYATSRKLEELIAKNVSIDLRLLQSISLDMNQYRSVAKKLDIEKRNDYDSLIAQLVPEIVEGTNSAIANANNVAAQQQPLPQPQQTLPQPQLEAKQPKGPLSPLKREMDQILKWISAREAEIRAYKAKQAKGYDETEYQSIIDQLAKTQAELSAVNDELSHAKSSIPVDPLAKELLQIEKWSTAQQSVLRKYLKSKDSDNNNEELKRIDHYLTKIANELNEINDEIESAKTKAPLDPLVKELNQILNWINSRQADVNAYKRAQRQSSIDDELKLIEKELSIVHNKSKDISTTINFINSHRPVDPYKKELDELLRWIASKERDIKQLRAATLRKERAMKLALADRIRDEINYIDQEIDFNNNLIEEQLAAQNKQHELQLENQKLKQQIDEQFKKQPNGPTLPNELAPQLYVNEIDQSDLISKQALLDQINDEIALIERELKLSKDYINEKQSIISDKEKELDETYPKEIVNKMTEEQLYDLAEIYDVEAAVLRTAIEVMPLEYQKFGFKALPSMLQHLLESGYIEIKDEYVLVNPENEYKLRQAKLVQK